MIRIFVLIMLIIGTISFTVTSYGATQQKRKPNNWQPIIGMRAPGVKLYIDANSLTVSSVEGKASGKYNSAEILVSYDTPTVVIVDGKKYTIRSMARSMVVECTTGLSAPVFDAYFKEPLPTRESLPLAGTEWSSDIRSTSTIIPRKSFLYGAVCPTYI